MRWTSVLDDTPGQGKGRCAAAPSAGTNASLKNAMELTNEYIVRNHGGCQHVRDDLLRSAGSDHRPTGVR